MKSSCAWRRSSAGCVSRISTDGMAGRVAQIVGGLGTVLFHQRMRVIIARSHLRLFDMRQLLGLYRECETECQCIGPVGRRLSASLHVLLAFELNLAIYSWHGLRADQVAIQLLVCFVDTATVLQPLLR